MSGMSGDRMDEMDQTSAIFSAFGSFWWRLVAFFACCWIGHYIGINAYSAGSFFESLWNDGLAALHESRLNPILVPLSWLWTLLSGCSHPLGLLQLLLLATAFLVVRLSEDRFYTGFVMVLAAQPIHSFLVSCQDSGTPPPLFLGFAIVLLAIWLAATLGLWWWFSRQME